MEQKNVLLIASVLGFSKRYNVFVPVDYSCSNRSESKVVLNYSGALPSIIFFKRPILVY